MCKAELLESANSLAKLKKLNVSDADVHVKPADIDIGFAATGTLAGLLRHEKVSDLQAIEFRKEFASMLVAIVTKNIRKKPTQVSLCKKVGKLGSKADGRRASGCCKDV